jgi:phosphonoacetaldehyde hydrolase
MTFNYHRAYIGPLQGVILDWSGTTVDYGCFAPTVVFIEMFKAHGVPISLDEARAPMGAYKRDHIATILQMPSVAARWQEAHGRQPDDSDVQALYDEFIPKQMETILAYADPIPGVTDTIEAFRVRGLKIGSTTGYTRAMMERLLPEAARRGYRPDVLVCPDEAGGGRPAPWMCFQNAQKLGVYPMESFVKIGDTLVDIAEGLNAGMWTIGLAKTGNELGLSESEVKALEPAALAVKLTAIRRKFYESGAHYVVDGLANTLIVLDQIDERLARGDKP